MSGFTMHPISHAKWKGPSSKCKHLFSSPFFRKMDILRSRQVDVRNTCPAMEYGKIAVRSRVTQGPDAVCL